MGISCEVAPVGVTPAEEFLQLGHSLEGSQEIRSMVQLVPSAQSCIVLHIHGLSEVWSSSRLEIVPITVVDNGLGRLICNPFELSAYIQIDGIGSRFRAVCRLFRER